MTRALEWIGAASGLAGALVLALNLSWSGAGFALFLVSSLALVVAARRDGSTPRVVLFAGYTAINLIGVLRWMT